MITIIEDLYIIGHFGQHSAGFFCYFRKNFFTEKTLQQVSLLPIFQQHSESCYPVNAIQAREITGIFEKLISEKDSDYIFSEDLQRTYLIELIHCITKIHQKTFSTHLN